MARNLVICLDGTAAQVRGDADSNSVRVYDMLDLSDETRQVAYYDPGVGTFSSPGAWTPLARSLSRLGGLIWGGGLRQNLGEAYLWLMHNWQPGDRIYVFGFSRGAFTARALTGMLRLIGLMRPGSENQLQYAVAQYARAGGESDIPWDEIHRFSGLFAQKVDGRSTIPVEFLGVWDTVKAMGALRWAPKWPFTRSVPNARFIRHAVSIDERRRPFEEYLVQMNDPKSGKPLHDPATVEEAWFAGVHTDVGGTFVDDSRLSTIALKWVVEGAIDHGLLVDPRRYEKACTIELPFAAGAAHSNSWVWNLVGPRTRPIPAGAHVHASVRARMGADAGYRPELTDPVWVDERWVTFRPLTSSTTAQPVARTSPRSAARAAGQPVTPR